MKDVSIDLSKCKDEKEVCKTLIGAELTSLYQTIGNEHNAKNMEKVISASKLLDGTRRIWVVGCGGSGIVANAFVGMAYETDLTDTYLLTNDLSQAPGLSYAVGVCENEDKLAKYYADLIETKDILVAISVSGETNLTYEIAQMTSFRGADIIVITANKESRLAKVANRLILLDVGEEGYVSSKSQTCSLFVCHILLLLSAWRRGVTEARTLELVESIQLPKHGGRW